MSICGLHIFTGEAFAELLVDWDVKHRFGAVGRHGSIAVTERVIRTLKYEWLTRVPVLKGLDHLQALLADFACYYNCWRPHSALQGAVPELTHAGEQWSIPPKTAKTVPGRHRAPLLPRDPHHGLPTRRLAAATGCLLLLVLLGDAMRARHRSSFRCPRADIAVSCCQDPVSSSVPAAHNTGAQGGFRPE